MHIALLFQLAFREHIVDVASNHSPVSLEQIGHLPLREPNRFILQSNVKTGCRVRLIDYNLVPHGNGQGSIR